MYVHNTQTHTKYVYVKTQYMFITVSSNSDSAM